jgi:DNA-binding response OmpR family regulator
VIPEAAEFEKAIATLKALAGTLKTGPLMYAGTASLSHLGRRGRLFIGMQLEAILRDAGAEVLGPATSSPEALRLIEAHAVSGGILDVRLVSGDSLPVARRLQADGVPFIFHTGNADTISSEWPRAAIVSKPAIPQTLTAALVAVIRSS